MTDENYDKSLMTPAVKWGNEKEPKKGNLITKACVSLWSPASDCISCTVPSAPSAAVSWPEKQLIVVSTACTQTGHYSPQPSTEWVYVGGCVWICGEVCTTELEVLQDITTALLPLT